MPANNPHDKFIKEILQESSHAIEILQEVLPVEIADLLDWNSLRNEPDSFVDEELSEYFSDALFSIQCKSIKESQRNIQLYLLFEHKSSPDKRIHFQLLNYLARIYAKQKQPEIVIPIVFYHGQQEWKIPESFETLFNFSDKEVEIFRKFIPGFEYALYDLSNKEMMAVQASAAIRSVLHVMKHIWHIEDESELYDWIQSSKELFIDEKQEKTVERILFYLYICTDIKAERVKNAISRIAPGHGDIAMSTATKLREEGKLEGIEQGIEQEKLETAKRMLKSGAELELVLQTTGLTVFDLKKSGLISE